MISDDRPNFDRLMNGHFLNAQWSVVVTTCTLKVYTSVIKRSKHMLFSDIHKSEAKLRCSGKF